MSYTSMTVVQLKKIMKEKGLTPEGKKADLIKTLQDHDATNPESSKETKGKKHTRGSDDEEDDNKNTKSPSKKAKVEKVEDTKPSRSSARAKAKKEEDDDKEESIGKWENQDSLYYLNSSSLVHSKKIASFDMDDTLIETKSGKTFATGRSDWQWLYPDIPDKLRELNKEGTKVVIFTNQGGIGGKGFDNAKYKAISGKIQDLISEVGFPMQAFIATADDRYRKPSTAMWDVMVEDFNGGIKPDLEECIFVGDAAGRAANWKPGRKKDFSCSDRKFAKNAGIKFLTPEEFFENEPSAVFEWGTFDMTNVASDGDLTEGGVATLTAPSQEIVLFVGFPASGKSTLARRYMVPAGYIHVNRDTLKTKEKCIKVAQQAVDDGMSVVIDNTNPDPSTRSVYIDMAKEAGIPIRCFKFEVEEKLANHLNYFRERLGICKHVPGIGYNFYKKNYKEPKLEEGFSELKKIQFVKNFEKPEHASVFDQVA